MTDARLEAALALPYAVEVVPDVSTDGEACYVARHPELPGCMSHGDSPEEAKANLEEARELYLRTLLEDGLEPPRPATLEARSRAPFVAIWTFIAQPAKPTTTSKPLPTGRLTRLGEGELVSRES
jgi:predicted RNase H-like HicB family nuclease